MQPGEIAGGSGCHEERTDAARSRPDLLALRKSPAKIEPICDVPDGLHFPRDIQPILNKHCLKCHNPEKPEGKIVLTDELKGWWTQAYVTLTHRFLAPRWCWRGVPVGRGRP